MISIMYNILKLCLILPLLLIAGADPVIHSSPRKLSYHFNPGCEKEEYEISCNDSQINLIHIRADSSEDTLHFLWSTWKLPTVIIAKTSHKAELNVNWTELYTFENSSVVFSETPSYSIGLVIKEVWEFTDSDDKVDMNLDPHRKPLNLTSLKWEDVNTTVKITENFITAFPKSSNGELPFSDNGSFAVKFSVMGEQAVSEDYPHLIFTGNSTQVQLVLDNLVTEHKSRFAVELVAFSSSSSAEHDWYIMRDRSISDEVSPGVFRFLQLKTPSAPSHDDYCKGVVSWKPVSYVGRKPTVANSSDAAVSTLNTNFSVSDTIAMSFFAQFSDVSRVQWYMTFGTSGDGFYTKTKYASWDFMVGVGNSISQGLSKTAILSIAIGLGLPLALMFMATIYLAVTQCRRKDDELLLSQDSMN